MSEGRAPVIKPEDSEVTRRPVTPEGRAPVTKPEDTAVSSEPVNPEDLPPADNNPLGPSKAGPDPVNPNDRTARKCCGGH